MTEFTTPPTDAISTVRIGNCEILFNYGKIDERCVVVKYPKQISKNRAKTYYWPVYDHEIYRSYMNINSIYFGHQKKWDGLVFDVFNTGPVLNEIISKETEEEINVNVEVNNEFISQMRKVFEKHDWVESVFSCMASDNVFSKVSKSGIQNIYVILFTARLIGESRDYMYNSYEYPTDLRIPISSCIGKHGTKDCLYKINKGIYPDFYSIKRAGIEGIFQTNEWDGKHYNISEILKDDIVPKSDLERRNLIHKKWATKLDNWYDQQPLTESHDYAKFRVLKCAKKSIYESLLSNENKEFEIMKLNEYRY